MNREAETFHGTADTRAGYARAAALIAAVLLLSGCTKLETTSETVTLPPVAAKPKAKPSHTAGPAAENSPVIALDPGHGPYSKVVDAKTGLVQVEGLNQPETDKVWNVALRVKNSLLADGYKVVMLKKSEFESVTFRERASRAGKAHADLALSIHGDPGLPHTGELFPQAVGLYRGSGEQKTVFHDAKTAQLSQRYSAIIQRARQKVEGRDIVVMNNTFTGRAGLEPGNEAMVELFAQDMHTPWVYSEKKMPFNNAQYSYSLVQAIEAAIPKK